MKRHTKQDIKQKTGSYYTTNASDLLCGFEYVVKNSNVVEPFAGGGDLTKWCLNNGATSVDEYDLLTGTNSIINPPLKGYDTIVTNPPYLSKNKNPDPMLVHIKSSKIVPRRPHSRSKKKERAMYSPPPLRKMSSMNLSSSSKF